MKKVLVFMSVITIVAVGLYFYYHESAPQGMQNVEAELMADKMLEAVNIEAWEQIPYVQFSFMDKHHYVWDKQDHLAMVKWDENEVKLNLDKVAGVAYKNGIRVTDEEADKLIEQAWGYWCNDSFWLNAPAKIRDKGTARSLVQLEDGQKGLLVEYEAGGVTPGDSYLWVLDENGMPAFYKMWVSIIPIGGVKATWDNWVEIEGAKISTVHQLGPMTVSLDTPKAANSLRDLGIDNNYFEEVR